MPVQTYLGNANLKAVGVPIHFTAEQVSEYVKCAQDPIYFIKTYVKVVHVDHGIVPFELYPYQEDIINAYNNNRRVIVKVGRQMGKTITTAAYFLWYVLFNDTKGVAILANKASVAREILSRIQFAYEELPLWLQQGVVEWNKGSIKLENGSRIIASATSPSAIRGFSVSALYIDETAFLPTNIADEFIASVFPTISSGKDTKIFLSSTPLGLNHFYKMWDDAEKGRSGFIPVSAHWSDNPTRDQKWADEQLKDLGEVRYNQEVSCEFLGSSFTLVDGKKLANIPFSDPINITEQGIRIWELPQKDRSYVITVDTSRGQHLDYSAFVVFDITEMPYRIVAHYKNNTIGSTEYPYLIFSSAKTYNDAYILVEVNDIGGEVANTLHYEYEYEHLYFTQKDKLGEGNGYPGIRTTTKVKAVGCSTLKELIEKDQLIIPSYDVIQELSIFVQKRNSYSSDDPKINDDLTSCLWLFAYLSKQPIFSELTNHNTRLNLAIAKEKQIAESMTPFGFIVQGEYAETNSNELPDGMTLDDWIMSDDLEASEKFYNK